MATTGGAGTKTGPERYRSIDGTGNNLTHHEWGSAGQQLLRLTSVAYGDGIATPAGEYRPSPRAISNAFCKQAAPSSNSKGLSNFIWAFGQFLDHELDLTEGAKPPEPFNMSAPANDPDLPNASIGFGRSDYDRTTGDSADNPRQQINGITSFIDASNVYGSDETRAAALRANDGTGKLRTATKPVGVLLPKNYYGLGNASLPGQPEPSLFLAGDVRANEHSVLTSLHTLFVREHNRLCDEVASKHPKRAGNDDQIYLHVRKIVAAEMQVIVYCEFLPALLGPGAIAPYGGYNGHVNPGISNVFSTSCYRVGHSMIPTTLPLGKGEPGLPLREGFFRPALIDDRGIEPFLRGLAYEPIQEIDCEVVEELRTFLFREFNPASNRLLDLAALNIQRGRDHGLADYNQCREDFGLARRTSFSEITSNAALAAGLEAVYGDVGDIDSWVGGLAEDHADGAAVGELIYTVLKDQFERTRDGDRFYFENDPDLSDDLDDLKATTLSQIVERNTTIEGLPDNVFVVPND